MVPRRTAAARMPRMSAAPRLSPLTLLGGVAVIMATALLVGTFVSLIPQVPAGRVRSLTGGPTRTRPRGSLPVARSTPRNS